MNYLFIRRRRSSTFFLSTVSKDWVPCEETVYSGAETSTSSMSGCPPAQCRASLQGGLTEGLHQVTPRGFHPRKGGVTSSERSRQVSSHLLGGCCRQVGVHLHHQIPPPLERKTALGSPTALSHPHLFNFSLPSKESETSSLCYKWGGTWGNI